MSNDDYDEYDDYDDEDVLDDSDAFVRANNGYVGDAEALLRDVIDLIATAPTMPLSSSPRIDRDDVVARLEDVLQRLPGEMRQARWMIRERQEFVAKTRREADELLEAARVQAERMVQRTEVVRAADARARQINEAAEQDARRLRHETEDFLDQRLASFEILLDRLQRTVNAGRTKLAIGSTRDVPVVEADDDPKGFFDQDRYRRSRSTRSEREPPTTALRRAGRDVVRGGRPAVSVRREHSVAWMNGQPAADQRRRAAPPAGQRARRRPRRRSRPSSTSTDPHVAADADVDIHLHLESLTDGDRRHRHRRRAVERARAGGACRPASGTATAEVHELYQHTVTDPDAFELVGDQLDLRPMVRELLLLEVPETPLCREDCAGLCPQCGVDRNDGRLRVRRRGRRPALGCAVACSSSWTT